MVTLALLAASGGFHVSTAGLLAFIGVTSFCLTAAGIVGMGFRVGSNTQTMANYRETAASWKEKSDAQEAQITALEKSSAAKDHQIAELQAKVEVLERLVLGESTARALRADHSRLEKKFTEAYDQASEMRLELHQVAAGVSSILDRMPS